MGISIKAGVALLGAGALVLAAASGAQASTIYSQTFSSTATGVLTGTAPATRTGGPKWALAGATGSDWSASGLAPTTTGGTSSMAAEYLPLTVTSGNIYTLTITGLAPVTGTTGNWLAAGFFNSTSADIFGTTSTDGPFMLLRDTGYIQAFGGPGANNGASVNGDNSGAPGGGGAGPFPLGDTAVITLNTGGAQWSVTGSYDGTSLGSTITYPVGGNPGTALGVGFLSYQSTQGSVGSLTLTETATPEPASLALIGLSAGALLLLKKRRTA